MFAADRTAAICSSFSALESEDALPLDEPGAVDPFMELAGIEPDEPVLDADDEPTEFAAPVAEEAAGIVFVVSTGVAALGGLLTVVLVVVVALVASGALAC